MATSPNDVSTLLSIITNSAKVIEASFQNTSKPYVPSIDDLEPHPFDKEISSLELKTATQSLEGACAQLCTMLTRPNHNLTNKFMHIYLSACIGTILNAKVPDIIGMDQSGMAVEEIGRQAGIEPTKLARVLRLLCTHHIFREVQPDIFANNRLSINLRASNPLTSHGLQLTDENYKATGHVFETLLDPEWGPSTAPNHAPLNRSTGFDQPLYAWYAGEGSPIGAVQGARFARAMMGFNETSEALALIHLFPWDKLPEGTTVNDVGGGVGHMILELAKRYPNLRLKLQDRPERVEQAEKEIWPQECPDALKENRVEFKGFDFFKDPPIAACDIYYIKHTLHNWPDEESIAILSNVKKAMGSNSRILIHEHILQTASRVPEGQSHFNQAPEPLLPNFGMGNIRQYNLDLNMLAMCNTQARTLEDHIRLGKSAGLEFVKLWDLGEMGMVEFRLPGSSGTL